MRPPFPAPTLYNVEQLTRILSWTFVFGAIATLLYTNFKPAWKELLDSDVPVESVQGSATGRDEAGATPGSMNASGTKSRTRDACAATDRSQRPSGCDSSY